MRAPPRRSHAQILALLLAGAIGIVVLWHFLFGDKVLLFTDIGGDTYYVYYPYYYLLTEYVSNLRLPWWSFQLGMGASVLSLFSLLYDPFSLVYFIAGAQRIAEALAWVFLLKILCSTWFTYLYVRYMHLQPQVRVLASVLYAFNGYLMVWGQHFPMGSWVVFLPLLLFAVERFFREGRWWLLCLLCAWMAVSISIFYQVVIFCACYVLMRQLWEQRHGSALITWRKQAGLMGAVALGVGLGAVLWLPEYALLSSSPRISPSFLAQLALMFRELLELDTPAYYVSVLNRLFSSNLEGVAQDYRGHLNYYESIQLYGGLLPLLVIPQAWVVYTRGRALLTTGMALAVAAVLLPAFGLLMNGLQYPSFRWGYGLILFQILLAASTLHAMSARKRIHVPLLTGTLVVWSSVLAFLSGLGEAPFAPYARVFALMVCYCVLLVWWIRAERRRPAFALLLLVLCVEMVVEHGPSFRQRELLPKGLENSGRFYFDGAFQAVQALRLRDPSFFRVEKNHWDFTPNAAVVQGYQGLDSYNSLNTPSYVELVYAFGIADQYRYARWNSLSHPYLADISSVKYHLTKTSVSGMQDMDFLGRYGDVALYARRGSLPFGFLYDTHVPAALLDRLSPHELERAMLYAAVLPSGAEGGLRSLTELPPIAEDSHARTARRASAVVWHVLQDDRMAGRIASPHGGLLFLSIPFAPGWSATVDGRPADILRSNVGFSGIHIPAGEVRIDMTYDPPALRAGAVVSAVCLVLLTLGGLQQRRQSRRHRGTTAL